LATDIEMFVFELYQQMNDPIIWVDLHGIIISLNPKAEDYFGYTKDELIGQKIEILVPDALKDNHRVYREQYQKKPTPRPMGRGKKLQAQHKNGDILDVDILLYPITIRTGQTVIAATIRNVQSYRIYERNLIDLYNHDSLTGLVTSTYLHTKLQELISDKIHFENLFALCVIDIDNFKYINDVYGHDAGNKILQQIAETMKNIGRKNDVVARLGGDEFIILLRDFKSKADITAVVKKIHRYVTERTYCVDDKQMKVSISLGVSIFPDDANNEELLFKKADEAMYAVKKSQKNNYMFYSSLGLMKNELTHKAPSYSEFACWTNFISFALFKSYINKILTQEPQIARYFLLIGVDNFKGINHIFGYEVADLLLTHIAARIYKIVEKENCILAHKDGDEFIVVLANHSERKVSKIAKEIIHYISQPFQIESYSLDVTASIGISCYPKDAHNRNEFLTHSDVALQQAKNSGKNIFKFYTVRDGLHLKRMQILRNDLSRALEHKEFFLCYQLQYDIINNKVIGAEALLRWQHPTLGLINPETFIPLIENTPLMNIISDWVLTEACQQAKHWQQWMEDFLITVNVSVSQLTSLFVHGKYKITKSIQKALAKSNLSPQSLELEVTEGLVLDQKLEKNILQKLKKLNIHIACDDFGMNFSSFNRLKDLPLSTIKTHGHLIKNITKDSSEYIIIDSLIKIAKKLNIRLIVEGVTQQKQIDMLRELGCQFVQGYYYSKPLTTDKFKRLLIRLHPDSQMAN